MVFSDLLFSAFGVSRSRDAAYCWLLHSLSWVDNSILEWSLTCLDMIRPFSCTVDVVSYAMSSRMCSREVFFGSLHRWNAWACPCSDNISFNKG